MKKLDKKFYGTIVKSKDNSIVPPDQYVVFLAKDNAFPVALRAYHAECVRLGADEQQLAAVDQLIVDVDTWRGQNRDKCKTPDVADPAELLGQ